MKADEQSPADGFFEFSIDTLMDNTSSHFDVYACVEGEGQGQMGPEDLVLYAKAPYSWTHREINELSSFGVRRLFGKKRELSRFQRYLKLNQPVAEIDQNLEARFRIVQVEAVGAQLIETAFISEIDDELMGQMGRIAQELTSCLREDPKSILQLKTLAEHDLYTYIHSVGVSSLSVAIALALGIKDSRQLQVFALGGLLHDIGKREVPLNILNKSGPLTEEEWGAMKAHPEMGEKIVSEFQVPLEAVDMISMHHEKLDGSGYPHNLTRNEIPIHVQIATVADIYSALTTSRCYHRKRTRFEALMFMKHNFKGKISAEVFRALVGCLAQDNAASSQQKGTKIA